jgi:hypothetical protein
VFNFFHSKNSILKEVFFYKRKIITWFRTRMTFHVKPKINNETRRCLILRKHNFYYFLLDFQLDFQWKCCEVPVICWCQLSSLSCTLLFPDWERTRDFLGFLIRGYQLPVSAARWPAMVPDMFCNFYLVKIHEMANNSATTEAREKISTFLESLKF